MVGSIIIFAAFDLDWYSGEPLGYIVLLFVVGLPALAPVHYVMSVAMPAKDLEAGSPTSGFTTALIFSMIAGSVALNVRYFLKASNLPQSTQDVSDMLHKIFLVIPHYAIADGVYSIEQNYANQQTCSGFKAIFCTENKNVPGSQNLPYHSNWLAWEYPGVGMHGPFGVHYYCNLACPIFAS